MKTCNEKYGHEFWMMIDRIVSARYAVESYISREMYISKKVNVYDLLDDGNTQIGILDIFVRYNFT